MREMFLATTLVLWEAAMYQAALEVDNLLSAYNENNTRYSRIKRRVGVVCNSHLMREIVQLSRVQY